MKDLSRLAGIMEEQPLSHVLCGDGSAERAAALQFSFHSIRVDFSKQRLTPETLPHLARWLENCQFTEKRKALFAGEPVNRSENRAAQHMAARWPADQVAPEGMDAAVAFCLAQRKRLAEVVEQVHAGQWVSATGQAFTDVINIGVGGSDLGPKLVCEALGDSVGQRFVRVHYVSTMDGSQLLPLMATLNPATTLVVLASKSFSTADSLFNMRTALAWLSEALGVDAARIIEHQVLGVSACPDKMAEFGIPDQHQLAFPETVGGRFSVWSTIGVGVALELGAATFDELLAGAHAVDRHFLEAPLTENLPVLLGAIGAWNSQHLGISNHVVLPYDGRLKSLVPYLQQLEMESNGKSQCMHGQPVEHATCPVLWGDIGPNAQHAFYQLLHQGSHTVSADFIAVAQRGVSAPEAIAGCLGDQQTLTLANCLAQSQLFALGDAAVPESLQGQMALGYRGNQPNTMILLDSLTPWNLGALLAMYEHKVFVQSVLWGLNPFDQPGVELGKKLATSLYQTLTASDSGQAELQSGLVHDASTEQLLEYLLQP